MTFTFRKNQLVWTEHKTYGWVQGKIQDKWEFEGHAMYRIVVKKEGVVDMLITASEKHFFKDKP